MGIEIRPGGETEATAQAGLAIGQGERAKEERARADRAAEQAAADRVRQMSHEWELQKALLDAQQDFAHEQRLKQAQLDAEARAHEWETEKMELHSRIEFEAEERERQKEIEAFLSTDKYINDKVTSGEWTPERAEGPSFINAYQHIKLGRPEIIARLGGDPEYVQKIQGRPVQSSLAKERQQLEAIVGEVEMPSLLSLPELRQRANEIMGETTGADLVAPTKTGAVATVRTVEDYNKLPSGAEYIDPNGNRRRKP